MRNLSFILTFYLFRSYREHLSIAASTYPIVYPILWGRGPTSREKVGNKCLYPGPVGWGGEQTLRCLYPESVGGGGGTNVKGKSRE